MCILTPVGTSGRAGPLLAPQYHAFPSELLTCILLEAGKPQFQLFGAGGERRGGKFREEVEDEGRAWRGVVSGNSCHYCALAIMCRGVRGPSAAGEGHTHLRRPKMKAWKRLRLLLSGASRLTWLYRDPTDCVQEPEDRGTG